MDGDGWAATSYGGFPPGTLEFAVRTLGECIAAASTDGEPLDQD